MQIKNMRCRRFTAKVNSEGENEDPKRLVAALWPTTIGIVIWTSVEEISGSARACLRVKVKDCVPVMKVMVVYVDDFSLIVQQSTCYFVVLILTTNTHEQRLMNP